MRLRRLVPRPVKLAVAGTGLALVAMTAPVAASPAQPTDAYLMPTVSSIQIAASTATKLLNCPKTPWDAASRFFPGTHWREWKPVRGSKFSLGRLERFVEWKFEARKAPTTGKQVERKLRAPRTGTFEIAASQFVWSRGTTWIHVWGSGGTLHCLGKQTRFTSFPLSPSQAASKAGGTASMWTRLKGFGMTAWVLNTHGAGAVQLRSVAGQYHFAVDGRFACWDRSRGSPPRTTGATWWLLGTCPKGSPDGRGEDKDENGDDENGNGDESLVDLSCDSAEAVASVFPGTSPGNWNPEGNFAWGWVYDGPPYQATVPPGWSHLDTDSNGRNVVGPGSRMAAPQTGFTAWCRP